VKSPLTMARSAALKIISGFMFHFNSLVLQYHTKGEGGGGLRMRCILPQKM
jgi:hypothetical protein